MKKKRSKAGRKIEYNDQYHRVMRERQRRYTEKNREVWNLAMREGIPVGEARKRLKEQKQKKGTKR